MPLGVGKLKRGVSAICSLALGEPVSNGGPKVWESGTGHVVCALKRGVSANCSLALGVLYSNRGLAVWENQHQVVILELFYPEKKQCIGRLLIGSEYEMLRPWPNSILYFPQVIIVQTTAKQNCKLLSINTVCNFF